MNETLDRLAIADLNAEFAYYLDRNEAPALAELFTPDALYVNGPRRLEGREAIQAFFEARAQSGRVSRHLYSGLRIRLEGDAATSTSLWIAYAQTAPLPLAAGTPSAIADFEDAYVRAEGRWLIRERIVQPVYMDPATPPPGQPTSRA